MILKSVGIKNYFCAAMCFCFDKNGRIWMLQKRKDHEFYPGLWGIPAGRIKDGEKPHEAMLREIKEETGNSLPEESIELFFVTNHKHVFKSKTGELTIHFKGYTFVSKTIFEKIILDKDEHINCLSVSPKNLLEANKRKILIPDTKEIYEMVMENMK